MPPFPGFPEMVSGRGKEGHGGGVRVYLTDTGTDASDFEFQGRVTTGYSTIPGEVADYDADGHGTHTAGLADKSLYSGFVWFLNLILKVIFEIFFSPQCRFWARSKVSSLPQPKHALLHLLKFSGDIQRFLYLLELSQRPPKAASHYRLLKRRLAGGVLLFWCGQAGEHQSRQGVP